MSLESSSTVQYRAIGPGRVNLLGEHVDYNDGMVLPAAIDRQVTISANVRTDRLVHLQATDLNAEVVFSLDELEKRQDTTGRPLPHWALYPAGVAWALQQARLLTRGFSGSYSSDIPIGSGLSSSAAVQVGFATLWQIMGGWQIDRMELAKICQRSEIDYVGVNCGLMDQFSSACGVEGHALYLDTRSLEWYPVPLPPQAAIIIADSTMRRILTSSAYNSRFSECRHAVQILQQHLPGITALRDVSPDQLQHYSAHLPEMTYMLAQHVVTEIARVQQAVPLLQSGDVETFGQLMFAGHASLRDLYQVSIPELDLLVSLAAKLPGCWGARLSGAGFGGCTVNLVDERYAEEFIAGLKKGYLDGTGKNAPVYVCHPSQGARAEILSQ